MSRYRTGRQPQKCAKALGGRLLLGELFAAAEAESLVDALIRLQDCAAPKKLSTSRKILKALSEKL